MVAVDGLHCAVAVIARNNWLAACTAAQLPLSMSTAGWDRTDDERQQGRAVINYSNVKSERIAFILMNAN